MEKVADNAKVFLDSCEAGAACDDAAMTSLSDFFTKEFNQGGNVFGSDPVREVPEVGLDPLREPWPEISEEEIEAVMNIGKEYSEPINWDDLIDVEDLPLDIGVEDSAVSAIEGTDGALSAIGEGFLDFSAANLEVFGVDAAEMSAEELIALGLLADIGLGAAF